MFGGPRPRDGHDHGQATHGNSSSLTPEQQRRWLAREQQHHHGIPSEESTESGSMTEAWGQEAPKLFRFERQGFVGGWAAPIGSMPLATHRTVTAKRRHARLGSQVHHGDLSFVGSETTGTAAVERLKGLAGGWLEGWLAGDRGGTRHGRFPICPLHPTTPKCWLACQTLWVACIPDILDQSQDSKSHSAIHSEASTSRYAACGRIHLPFRISFYSSPFAPWPEIEGCINHFSGCCLAGQPHSGGPATIAHQARAERAQIAAWWRCRCRETMFPGAPSTPGKRKRK